jgi:hypothetical protein
MRPREPRRFQRLPRFSLTPNVYNNLGNLLSLKQQPRCIEEMKLGHSFGTTEKAGGLPSGTRLLTIQGAVGATSSGVQVVRQVYTFGACSNLRLMEQFWSRRIQRRARRFLRGGC